MSHPDSAPPRPKKNQEDPAITSLKEHITAQGYIDGIKYQIIDGLTNLHSHPDIRSELYNQLLYGEYFIAHHIENGWALGQATKDGYVGYCRADSLSPDFFTTTHHVTSLCSHIYPQPDIKIPPIGQIYMMSNVSVINDIPHNGFVQLADGNWIFATHISNIPCTRPISEALKFLYAPYLWGGRCCGGIDCSALIQLSFAAAGISVPRDSNQQAKVIGTILSNNSIPRQGDIAFFPGHVGFMLDDMHLLHANAHHMRVSIDPLKEVIDIISFQTDAPPLTSIKRIDVYQQE